MRHRLVLIAVVITALTVSIAGTLAAGQEVLIWANANDKPKTSDKFSAEAYEIGVDAVHFFTLRTAAAGYTLLQRACIVDLRITEALSRRLMGPVVVKAVRGQPTVYVGPVRLVTVYPRDVAASKAKDAQELASVWAAALVKGLPTVMPGSTVKITPVP